MTVGQIDQTMTQKEIMEWHEFASIEPFGLGVQDAMHAHQIAMYGNFKRDPTVCPEPFNTSDFLLFREPDPVPEVEPLVDGLTDKQWRQKFAMEALAASRSKSV